MDLRPFLFLGTLLCIANEGQCLNVGLRIDIKTVTHKSRRVAHTAICHVKSYEPKYPPEKFRMLWQVFGVEEAVVFGPVLNIKKFVAWDNFLDIMCNATVWAGNRYVTVYHKVTVGVIPDPVLEERFIIQLSRKKTRIPGRIITKCKVIDTTKNFKDVTNRFYVSQYNNVTYDTGTDRYELRNFFPPNGVALIDCYVFYGSTSFYRHAKLLVYSTRPSDDFTTTVPTWSQSLVSNLRGSQGKKRRGKRG